MRKRRKTIHRRHVQVVRGRRQVKAALATAVFYYVGFFIAAIAGRFGDVTASLLTISIAGVLSGMAVALAIAAYFSHGAIRHIYLLFNLVAGMTGIFFIGLQVARGGGDLWLALDLAGVAAALFVYWVFCHSKPARTFIDEQEHFVKRQ